MWTTENRARYDRSGLRYPTDLTEDEWGLVEPLIPARTSFDPLAPAAKGRPSRVGTRSKLVRTGISRQRAAQRAVLSKR